jgi:hypothetical protein
MKNAFVFLVSILAFDSYSQTLYVPSSTSGIGASANANSVGIGTASPRGQFDVAGLGDIFLVNNPVTGTAQSILLPGHIYMAPFNGTNWTYLQARRPDNSGSTNLMIRTWNAGAMSDAMSISSGGSVGIGTASPQQKLHVKSGALMSSSASFDNINLRADGTNVPALKFTRWVGSGSVQHNAFVGQFYNPSAGNEYSFGIGTGVSSSGDQDINNKVLTVTLNGNVGIGTTSPSEKLEVNGNLSVGLNAGAATGYGNRLDLRGLDDAASFDPMWLARYNVGANQTELRVNIGDDSSGDDAFTVGNFFHGDGQWKTFLKVLNNGNVGIGTAAPIARLQVESGSDAAIALRLQSGGFSMNGTAPFSIDANGVFSGRFVVLGSGNVGIGIANPTQKLQVKGTVYSTEVKVDLAAGQGPDYVFEPTYDLKPLAEIETYIKENKHLPEVPSAKEMEANGVQLGEMNMLLLKKIEELTLYVIELKNQNEELKNRVEKIENKK